MKKFLLFAAAALVASSAFAAEKVLAETDFTTASAYQFWAQGVEPKVEDGALVVTNDEKKENFWNVQYIVADNMAMSEGTEYTVSVKIKGFSGPLHYVFGGWDGKDGFAGAATVEENADWQTVSFSGKSALDLSSGVHLLLQTGDFVGTYYIANVKITYNDEGQGGGDEPSDKTLDMLPSLNNAAYDATTKTITFEKAWDWINWWFGDRDFSEYDNFVLEFEPVAYTVQVMVQYNEGDDQPVQAQAGESKLVVPLDAAHKNSIKQIAIQNSEPGSLTLTAAYFAASAGVNAPSVSPILNGVYNLQGVKVADEMNSNLPKGLYIVNGKKVVR